MEFPKAFVQRMNTLLGDEADAFFEGYRAHSLRRGLRVNTLLCDKEAFLSVFKHPLTPSPFADDTFYLDAPHKAGADPLHHAGAYYMQEPSASSAVTVLDPKPGEYVLDLCAAPGGKSTQIAAALRADGLLWCNEYVSSRAQVLCQNLERLGVRNAVVSNADTTPLCKQLQGCFDAVLADVPCSGEGMFRKEEVALSQWNEQLVFECAARGKQILHNASLAVRAGGRIVYSTCTFAPEENEIQIAHFLKDHPDFELIPINVAFGRPAQPACALIPFDKDVPQQCPTEYCRRIFPADGGEGHFIALLQKKGHEERQMPRLTTKGKGKTDDALHMAKALIDNCFTDTPNGIIARFRDTIRIVPVGIPHTRDLRIVQSGTALGTVAKNRIEPHHAYFASCLPQECRRTVLLSLDDPRTTAFLHGEEITVNGPDGYTLVCVETIPLGFGKASRGTLKNRYPKGLRTV